MTVRRTSRWVQLRRHRSAMAGGVVVVAFIVLAFVGLGTDAMTADAGHEFAGPSLEHPLGTDGNGRDFFALMAHGAGVSLLIGLMSVSIAAVGGIPLGLVAAYFGGAVDHAVMRVIDVLMAFPSILLALTIVAVLGPALEHVMIAVGIVGVPQFARQVRGSALVVKQEQYVAAARALGFSHARVLVRHVLTNCLTPILVLATLGIGTAILDAAGLAFLGLAGDPSVPEWGTLLFQNRKHMMTGHAELGIIPGLGIFLVVLGFNLLGDGLRDVLDPRWSRAARR